MGCPMQDTGVVVDPRNLTLGCGSDISQGCYYFFYHFEPRD